MTEPVLKARLAQTSRKTPLSRIVSGYTFLARGLAAAMLISVSAVTFAEPLNIVADENVFGVPWDADQDTLSKTLGEPNGSFTISKYKELVFYGKSHSFLFVRGKLKTYFLDERSHHALQKEAVAMNQEFDVGTITLNGKEVIGKTFSEVESHLGVELGDPDYRAEIITDLSTVELSFTSSRFNGGTPSFRLTGFTVHYEL